MKRVFTIFCLGVLLISAASTRATHKHVKASINLPQGNMDVLIQTDGATRSVIDQISASGGVVTFAYENAPVLAANLPAAALAQIYSSPNVIRIAKDHPLKLLDASLGEEGSSSSSSYTLDAANFIVNSLDPGTIKSDVSFQGYGGFLVSGVYEIWDETRFGDGSVVAVVDTGSVPNICLQDKVIGAPGFPEGFNATGDGISAMDPQNHWHGTHIAGIIASSCWLNFSNDPLDPLNQAVAAHLPWVEDWVPIFGHAPGAQIYPVKIFETGSDRTSTATILLALDHLLSLKRSGTLDIDVVNLSFGGPTGFEGRAILDTLLEQFKDEGMLVIAAAGNNGPLPNSLATPASSLSSLAVGALDYADISRVYYEYQGLEKRGIPGQGLVMRPTEELRVADLSSRGPFSDGRPGPDLVAPGMWSFQVGSQGGLHWDSGTSYAAAAASGAAALLNAAYESQTGADTPWLPWRNSLLLGADQETIAEAWQGANISGYGALDAAAALEILNSGNTHLAPQGRSSQLRSNILANPNSNDLQEFNSGEITLQPSTSFDTLLDITSATRQVTIQVYDIQTDDNTGYAYWPNSLKILVQSAKRSAAEVPINRYWDLFYGADHFTINIEDGNWIFDGEVEAFQPMEPGLMKISLIADFANESPVSFKVKVTRQQDPDRGTDKPFAQSIINMGDVITLPVEIPEGSSKATFDLRWNRDWINFPTSDLDLLVFDPEGNLASTDGMSWNAPERVIIIDPTPGTWMVQVEAREVYKSDLFRLFLEIESGIGGENQFDIISQHPVSESSPGTGNDTNPPYTFWLPLIP